MRFKASFVHNHGLPTSTYSCHFDDSFPECVTLEWLLNPDLPWIDNEY